MADKLADLSPEDKEKRIAEMKAKMQAAAAKNKAASGEPAKPPAAAPTAAPAAMQSSGDAAIAQAAATAPAARAVPAEAPAQVVEEATRNAESDHPAPVAPSAQAAAAGAQNHGAAGNGASANGGAAVATAPMLVAPPLVYVEETPAQKAKKDMSRREFLTYAWGATLGLLALQGGVGMFFFMYPRFKAGEFGGVFFIGPESALPATDAPPKAETAGKFWLVNTVDEGPKALYMVCTHLGCLYKWEQSNNRFECPCHGSKFSREGFYIAGPASRSLDTFLIAIENGEVSVDTGKKTLGSPSADSPARAEVA